MKNLFLFCGLMLFWAGVLPAQNFVVPSVPEVNRKLDSLARTLRSEFANTKPVEPTKQPCEYTITFTELSQEKISGTGLTYRFHSTGVEKIKETIYAADGRMVWTGTSKPISSYVTIAYNLPPGQYRLKIENALCVASDERGFTIHSSGDREEPTVPTKPTTGFKNQGVYSKEVGGLLYEWIPSESISVTIDNGKIRLTAPETKTSHDGTTKCYRFLLVDPYDIRPTGNDEKALFGEGLALQPGQYTFRVIYLATTRWPMDLGQYLYYDGSNRGGFAKSAQSEGITISITTPGMQQYRASWIPQYQILNEGLKLPEDKLFGITRYLATVPHDNLFNNVTHVQNPGGVFNYKGPNFYWMNVQARPGTRQPEQVVREAPIGRKWAAFAELAENYGNDENNCPYCYEKAEQVFKGLYGRYKQELGVTSPYQTNLFGDYYTATYGGSFAVPNVAPYDIKKQGLTSISQARLRPTENQGVYRWTDCGYLSSGWIDYRNYITNGYLGNIMSQAGKQILYNRVYNHEKAALAIPDRKRVSYIMNMLEPLQMDAASNAGLFYDLPISGGSILRAEAFVHSFETMRDEVFYSLLYGNGAFIWESNTPQNEDPELFVQSWWGGQDDWKTKWRKDGRTSTFQPGQNGAPSLKKGNGEFPEKPLIGDQGAYIGAKDFEVIQGRVSELWYPDFTINGKGIKAVRGNKGQSVSVNGIQNESQTQLAEIEKERLPIVIKGKGADGEVIIYQNPNAGLTEEQGVEVEGKFFRVTGNRLNVIKL